MRFLIDEAMEDGGGAGVVAGEDPLPPAVHELQVDENADGGEGDKQDAGEAVFVQVLDGLGEKKTHDRVEVDRDAVAVAVAVAPLPPAGDDVGLQSQKNDGRPEPGFVPGFDGADDSQKPNWAPEKEAAPGAQERAIPGGICPVKAFAGVRKDPRVARDIKMVGDLGEEADKDDCQECQPSR